MVRNTTEAIVLYEDCTKCGRKLTAKMSTIEGICGVCKGVKRNARGLRRKRKTGKLY